MCRCLSDLLGLVLQSLLIGRHNMFFRVHLEDQVLQTAGMAIGMEMAMFGPDHGLNSSVVT